MAEILEYPGMTINSLDPDKVLKAAIGKLDTVIVIGVLKEDNDVNYFASSTSDGKTILWQIEMCKLAVFQSSGLSDIIDDEE